MYAAEALMKEYTSGSVSTDASMSLIVKLALLVDAVRLLRRNARLGVDACL
jgi:hypothetical protein